VAGVHRGARDVGREWSPILHAASLPVKPNHQVISLDRPEGIGIDVPRETCSTVVHKAVATSEEWAWAAAIFEGFGSVTTLNQGRDLRLGLHLTERDLGERYAAIVGVRLLGPYRPAASEGGTHRPSYRCNLNGQRAVAALDEMGRWLGDGKRGRLAGLGFTPPGGGPP
jgi:hypothetical protein